ncbi:hypothetical protein [Photobacterium lutimaris]|uniref:hypothetical protein n=1 Tax=Photobacterium lutimaris TaxID=388278 RepID=UPI001060B251|nr:hypothetical protein [Photobacterium lutimaris]
MASVREATAKSYRYRSASSLLADLPVEFEEDFTGELTLQLNERHKIVAPFTLYKFPFPEYFPLSDKEKKIVWTRLLNQLHQEASSSNYGSMMLMLGMGLTAESILKQPVPEGFTPDGFGKWYCSLHNALTKHSDAVKLDPSVLFPESLATPELVTQVARSLKPLCFQYWDKNCGKRIHQKAANLCHRQLIKDDGKPLDISSFIDYPFNEVVNFILGMKGTISSPSLNHFSNFQDSPFLPQHAREPLEFEESLFGGLVQEIVGKALIPSNRAFSDNDLQELIWSPLEAVKPYTENFQDNKYDFYRAFIWCDLFKVEIERFCKEWLESQPAWTMPFRDLVIIPITPPKKIEQLSYTGWSSAHKEEYHSDLLNIYINPYNRGQDEFGYHEDLDELLGWDDEEESETGEEYFDETSYREDLAKLVECGEIEESEIAELVEEARLEAEECAIEERDERKYNEPFVSPFSIEFMAVDRNNESKETEFCFYGHFFSELGSVSALGRHADLMDSLSRDLNSLSMFVRKFNGQLDIDADVFYITDIILSSTVSVKEMASELERALILAGRSLRECLVVINSEALSDNYFIGAPYSSSLVLKQEYEAFACRLIEELECRSAGAKYFSV